MPVIDSVADYQAIVRQPSNAQEFKRAIVGIRAAHCKPTRTFRTNAQYNRRETCRMALS